MPNLKEVKSRITSVVSTQQITKAMKMVAAAKLRRSQDRMMQMRPYASRMQRLLQNVSSVAAGEPAWYNTPRPEQRILLVVITSDRGLCGNFNSTVCKAAIKRAQEEYGPQHEKGLVTILPLGKKGYEFFGKRNQAVIDSYWGVFQTLSFKKSNQVAHFIIEAFRQRRFDKVEIIYNEFKNVATQIQRTEQFLPILPAQETAIIPQADYIYQPDREEILKGLIPMSLCVRLFKALLESNAAENGARMTAMDKATENAGELLKDLRLAYNRTRQAAITKEILEIVAGAEALKAS